MHTVKDVARLANVSVRTLHHYDSIGLLKPACIGENRYRYYGEKELLRLQQILFYREFGVPLQRIAEYLDQPGFDHVAALREHRKRLRSEAERYRQLIGTIDRTIARLTKERAMQDSDLYKGFSPEKQHEYERWLVDQHGPDMQACIDTSKQYLSRQTPQERDARMAELEEIENAFADRLRSGVPAKSEALGELLERHRAWVAQMWGRPCPPEAYAGLADLYLSHPDFEKRYELINEGLTAYLTTAMKAHAKRH
jgi:MerR family transcriptional regulator, thiopeptide resistance regulator